MSRRWRAPDTLFRPQHWSTDAACRSAPPELFHPEGDEVTITLYVAAAKSYCAKCSVRAACLEDALARGELYGVWGGLDERERRGLIQQARAARRQAAQTETEAAGTALRPAGVPVG